MFLFLSGCNHLSNAYRPEVPSSSQDFVDFVPGKWIRFRDLQTADFAAARDKNVTQRDADRFDAYIAKAIILSPYALLGIAENNTATPGQYRLLADHFFYFAALDTENSWWNDRPDLKDLEAQYTLAHENIHFMIHELAARKINQRVFQSLAAGYYGNDATALIQQFVEDTRRIYEQEMAIAEKSDVKFDIQTSLAFRPKTQDNWQKKLKQELFVYRAASFDQLMQMRFPNALNSTLDTLQFTATGRFKKLECVPVIQPVSLSGYRCLPTIKPRLDQSSTRIPAQKGNAFGVVFDPESHKLSPWTELQVLVHFPAEGIQPPDYEAPVFTYLDHVLISNQETATYYYHLLEDWEAVPGTWVFEFYSQGKKIAEQAFDLTPPGNQF